MSLSSKPVLWMRGWAVFGRLRGIRGCKCFFAFRFVISTDTDMMTTTAFEAFNVGTAISTEMILLQTIITSSTLSQDLLSCFHIRNCFTTASRVVLSAVGTSRMVRESDRRAKAVGGIFQWTFFRWGGMLTVGL